jgi:sporulation protein YlmC with PRC-barrel domain
MKFLIASTAIALVLASSVGWAASSTDTLGAHGPAAGEKPDHAMINVMPARQIVGHDLKDAQGIDAGKINSLVIDTKSGAVEFVMITPAGSLNADNQLIAAPWAALDPPTTADGPITTKFSVDKLAKAPRIDPRLIFELSRPGTRDRMYGYYGADFPSSYRMGPDNPIEGAGKNRQFDLGARDRQIDLASQLDPKPPNATNRDQPAGSGALVLAENGVIAKLAALTTTSTAAMHDSDIYDSNGKDIGELDETMIDVNGGRVAYVLVSHGGFLGMDENLYVAPIEALSISSYRNGYRLTVNAKILEQGPALHVERGILPSRVSAAQLATLYQRFGVQPYLTQSAPPASSN